MRLNIEVAEILSFCSPLQLPTAILNWALYKHSKYSAIFTVFIELVKPKLDICAISAAVYSRYFLVAGTHLVSVHESTQ